MIGERDGMVESPIRFLMRGEEPTPDDDAIVSDLIWPGSKTLLVSAPKTGKSFFAIALAAAVQAGTTFLGRPTEPTGVIYLTEEPSASFDAKLERFGIPDRDPSFVYIRRSLPGVAGAPWADVVASTAAAVAEYGAGLVVVDVLSRWANFTEGQENDQAVVGRAIDALSSLTETGVAALILQHATWGEKRSRGSTNIVGSVDDLFYLDGDVDGAVRILESQSGRHEVEVPRIAYRLAADGRSLEALGNLRPSAASRTASVIGAVEELVATGSSATAETVATALGWDVRTARKWLQRTVQVGLLGFDVRERGLRIYRKRTRADVWAEVVAP